MPSLSTGDDPGVYPCLNRCQRLVALFDLGLVRDGGDEQRV